MSEQAAAPNRPFSPDDLLDEELGRELRDLIPTYFTEREWGGRIALEAARRLRERTDTGEGDEVAWEVRHGKYVELWTARRKDSAIRQVESLREAYPDDEVTLRPLGYLRHQPTDEGREG